MSARISPITGEMTRSAATETNWSRLLGASAGYVLLLLVTLIFGVPIFWMASASLKDLAEIYTFPPIWWPTSPRWENYLQAWQAAPFGLFFFNSIFTTAATVLLKMINAVLSAYALVFLRAPGRNVVFIILLAALMVPEQALILPNYLTASQLGWVNTYSGLILPNAGVAFGTFLLRQHFMTLPKDILEAARLEGAGHRHVLWHIAVPLSTPVLATVALISAVGRWNDFLWPLIITNSNDMRVLPVGLAFLFQQEGTTQWGVVMAGTVLVVAPVLLFFFWAQRYLVAGLTAGAMKG